MRRMKIQNLVVTGDPQLARQVFERGYKDLKVKGLNAKVRPAAS
jgi:hypothetical protein